MLLLLSSVLFGAGDHETHPVLLRGSVVCVSEMLRFDVVILVLFFWWCFSFSRFRYKNHLVRKTSWFGFKHLVLSPQTWLGNVSMLH